MKQLIFVSSVQKELADEREAIRDFVQGNRLLGKHFDVFIFEDLPAKSRRPDDLYLDKVEARSAKQSGQALPESRQSFAEKPCSGR